MLLSWALAKFVNMQKLRVGGLSAMPEGRGAGRRPPGVRPAVLILCALALLWNAGDVAHNRGLWGVDFNQFYSSSRLAGTGRLYDWDALRKLEAENTPPIPTARLPIVSYGYKLFAVMPFRSARYAWLAASLAALIAFAALWPGVKRRDLWLALICSLPAAALLLYGQDVPFWMMFFAAGLALLQRGKPRLAGLAFSLCVCKYHLALGLPVMLAAQKRWTALISGAAATGLWVAASFAVEGSGWPAEYWKILKLPDLSPKVGCMPNVYGLASWLPGSVALEAVAAVAVAGLLWTVCLRTYSVGVAGAAAAAGGLLLSHHAYPGDCLLLLPLCVATIGRSAAPRALKAWAVLLLTPALVKLLFSPVSYVGQALVVGFVVASLWVARQSPGSLQKRTAEPSA